MNDNISARVKKYHHTHYFTHNIPAETQWHDNISKNKKGQSGKKVILPSLDSFMNKTTAYKESPTLDVSQDST